MFMYFWFIDIHVATSITKKKIRGNPIKRIFKPCTDENPKLTHKSTEHSSNTKSLAYETSIDRIQLIVPITSAVDLLQLPLLSYNSVFCV